MVVSHVPAHYLFAMSVWAVVPDAAFFFFEEVQEQLKEVCKNIGVKKAGRKVAGLGKVVWWNTQTEPFSLPKTSIRGFRSTAQVIRITIHQISMVREPPSRNQMRSAARNHKRFDPGLGITNLNW